MNYKAKFGIVYILLTLTAWYFVKFYKLHFYQITNQNEFTNIIINEIVRFIVFLGPIIIFIGYNFKKPWYRWLGLYGCKKGTFLKTFVIAIIYAIVSSLINVHIFQKEIYFSEIPLTFWLTAFSLSIIMEEIAFRGFLFYLFDEWNKNKIVVVTSLAFAAKHVPGWFLFSSEVSTLGFFGDFFMIFLVGGILGYLYLATHSVWATSMIHALNNFIVAIFNV